MTTTPPTPAGPTTNPAREVRGADAPDLAASAVEAGARAYFDACRARIAPFTHAHFSLRGTLRLHRAAIGWDIVRAPLNLSLAAPQLALHLAAALALKLRAPRLARALNRSILLPTTVSRDIEWLIHTELFALPFAQPHRASTRDALAETILATCLERAGIDPANAGADPAFRTRLTHAIATYGATRSAAAEITTGLVTLGVGALALEKLTPGAATLGPAIAAIVAQQSAIAAFPLGGWLGGLWYGLFPAAPTFGLLASTTGALMFVLAIFAAFAGIVFDPVQRALGLHQRRLRRMIDTVERQFFAPASPGFAVRDAYVARLLDLLDVLGAVTR